MASICFKDLHQVGPGAAAGVQHIDPGVGQAVGDAQFLPQDGVHPGHHVLHDLRRGVPDAQVLAEFGVVGFQEGLIEILDGVASSNWEKKAARSTRFRTVAVQSRTSTSPRGPSLVGVATCSYKDPDHGDVEIPGGQAPVEKVLGGR